MTPTENNPITELCIKEYESLKHEQIQRLGFRDNLIYANLIAMAGILSIAATDVIKVLVLLVLPLICVVLGWTYLVNDEKISAIGRYIRYNLSDKIRQSIKNDDQSIFGWETAHRADSRRISRKITQLVVDELAFVLPGFIAIVMFWINAPGILLSLRWIAILEGILLAVLGVQIYVYADLKRGK
jgi:hypothetical protein